MNWAYKATEDPRTIDHRRRDNIASRSLVCPARGYNTPPHSHAMVSSNDNASI